MTENATDMAKQTAQASMENIKDLYDLAHKEADEVDEVDEERDPIREAQTSCYGVSRETVMYFTLADGGPSVRAEAIYEDGEANPVSVTIEYSDWLKPWQEMSLDTEEATALEWFIEVCGGKQLSS